ncbi:hypothetical protein [Psychromonas antarctica]|uniref:hypothetical protein n=1 Tax=Psychromonas antarctica TaxID=67573 RepID=UPI001EE7959B|nr:hypothetical protein [Psychromonas antarctica]MCG6200931.1 hypothetical protein [Psychromonas antarctica]
MKNNKVKLLLSLDYELFFGDYCGSVENCVIQPTQLLLTLLDKYNYKVCLFVDAGFLVKLKQESHKFPILGKQYTAIKQQLKSLSEQGHDIQLHIHPHWQDSYYDGRTWVINTQRYRLHDFNPQEISAIVKSYKQELESCSKQAIFAFRAGGWCLQPFEKIERALKENDIWLDSTVFSQGHSDDPTRWFDFNTTPDKAYWHFNEDPLIAQENGYFTELPISATKTSPWFFWKLALRKKFATKLFTPFSDGQAMVASRSYYIERLTKTTYGPVMIDGSKAGQLESAFKEHLKLAGEGRIFNVMGHPKSLSPYSLIKLESFIKAHKELKCITYQDLKHLKNA